MPGLPRERASGWRQRALHGVGSLTVTLGCEDDEGGARGDSDCRPLLFVQGVPCGAEHIGLHASLTERLLQSVT